MLQPTKGNPRLPKGSPNRHTLKGMKAAFSMRAT